jgi:type I restriction enzyme M protein
MKNFDVILTNPPFGTKKGGERVSRDDLTIETSNKQLNFLQLIYNALKDDGKGRAAVVLPDNVLFESGVGTQIRRDLMNKCNLHTILRLPPGIFYAQGVKTNVLFFARGKIDQGNTKEVWVYDLRTNMPSFGKRNQLTMDHFEDFMKAYVAEDRSKVEDERWNKFIREEIAKKHDSLDIGLIADESLSANENLPDPIESAEEAIIKLQQAMDLLNEVVDELRAVEVSEDE